MDKRGDGSMLLSAYQVRNVLRVYRDQLKEINGPVHRIDPIVERIFPPTDNIKKVRVNNQFRNLITQITSKYLTYR